MAEHIKEQNTLRGIITRKELTHIAQLAGIEFPADAAIVREGHLSLPQQQVAIESARRILGLEQLLIQYEQDCGLTRDEAVARLTLIIDRFEFSF